MSFMTKLTGGAEKLTDLDQMRAVVWGDLEKANNREAIADAVDSFAEHGFSDKTVGGLAGAWADHKITNMLLGENPEEAGFFRKAAAMILGEIAQSAVDSLVTALVPDFGRDQNISDMSPQDRLMAMGEAESAMPGFGNMPMGAAIATGGVGLAAVMGGMFGKENIDKATEYANDMGLDVEGLLSKVERFLDSGKGHESMVRMLGDDGHASDREVSRLLTNVEFTERMDEIPVAQRGMVEAIVQTDINKRAGEMDLEPLKTEYQELVGAGIKGADLAGLGASLNTSDVANVAQGQGKEEVGMTV